MLKISEMQRFMASKTVKLITENNPALPYKFTADPTVLVYNDTVYVYGTNDFQQLEYTLGKEDNAYNVINSLNVFSSKDLVNWTDHGSIAIAGPNGAAKWAKNSWAPAVCTKKINGKDKFFIYFADSANGIGVVCADSPLGPFTDPRGSALVSRSTPNCAENEVYWLFDPAVLIDDDSKAYLYFGGGVGKDSVHPKSGRCVELSDNMIEIIGTPTEIDAPWLFEDSGINKINGKYYYTYCSNWDARENTTSDLVIPIAVIAYMTSDSPLGPFTYKGWTLQNPGTYFGAWGNNHHWIFELNNKLYIAYHTQTTEKSVNLEKGGYRNLFFNELKINEDGSFPIQDMKKEGIKEFKNFNIYETIPAATSFNLRNIAVTNVTGDSEISTLAIPQRLIPIEDNAYVCIKNADFSEGARKIIVTTSKDSEEGSITFKLDNFATGEIIGTINVKNSGEHSISIYLPENLKTVHNLYIVLTGNIALESWKIEK